ncbi:MAG: hypothetical protein ACKVS8_08535 [Phycisphaerales bacterium]
MPTRGVLYIRWGPRPNPRLDAEFKRSMDSLRQHHPDLPTHTAEVEPFPEGGCIPKSAMYDLSPFDETLFIDADTVVMGDLRFGFEQAARHGIAVCVCECPWARRYEYAMPPSEMVEYNSGVLFFSRRPDVEVLMREYHGLAHSVNSRTPYTNEQGQPAITVPHDQCAFAMAVAARRFNPFVLPQNWNYRARWQRVVCGPVRIWHDHDPPPPGVVERSRAAGAVAHGARWEVLAREAGSTPHGHAAG